MHMQDLGAFDLTEALTPLGRHLIRMPVDPRIGKMLILGALLRCVDPVLTIAAALGHGRSVFYSPPDQRQEAEAARKSVTGSVVASKSDHLAIVAAFNCWQAVWEQQGRKAASAFSAAHFMSEEVHKLDYLQFSDHYQLLAVAEMRFGICVALIGNVSTPMISYCCQLQRTDSIMSYCRLSNGLIA